MPSCLAVVLPRVLLGGMLLLMLTTLGCRERQLRGDVRKSPDGRTYLVIEDDNGGGCGPILVDGRRWAHALHAPGLVEPGPAQPDDAVPGLGAHRGCAG